MVVSKQKDNLKLRFKNEKKLVQGGKDGTLCTIKSGKGNTDFRSR